MGVMCGDAGCPSAQDFESFSATVTVTSPVTALTLTPATAASLLGADRTLALADQNGIDVTGATWTVDNTFVLTLSTDDPPVLTTQNSGTATVKASLGSLSAQATINVITPGPHGGFPGPSALWDVAPLSGFVPSPTRQGRPTAHRP